MKRYYISPVIEVPSAEFGTEYRTKIADYGVPSVAVIPSDPVTGKPLATWALVLVSTNNHGAILADATIDALPDFPLDGKVSAIQTATKNAMISKLQARGIDTAFIGSADGYRDVIRGIGQKFEPAFNENNFDVS